MKKLLIYLILLLPLWMSGQVIPTTKNTDGSIVLSGKGNLGGLNDNVQLRRYKFPTQGNFEVSGYFRSISNKNSAVGFLFRNEGTASNKSLATAGVILQRDSLKCVIRYRNNTTMDLVASTPNISLPCHLKEEKNGNSLKYYYSKQPENATAINWILVLKVENVFTEWTGLNHNVLNPAGASAATAVLASLNFKTVMLDVETDTRPSCNNGGSFVLASVTKSTGTLYNVDFSAANLTNAQVIIKNTVTNTTVRDITQAITARPQSIDFGTLTNGSYTVQLVGKSCKGSTNEKAFTVSGITPPPTLVSCLNNGNFSIASVVNTTGSTYAVDFNAANFSSTQVILKNAGGTVISDLIQAITARPQSIDFGTLATGSYTVQFVGTSCSGTSNAVGFSAVGPVGEGGSGIVGALVDMDLTAETMWNRFQPDLIPDFIPAKSVDAKTGQNLPNKWFIWHAPYRNLFGNTEYDRLVNMTKKGVTAWNISKLPIPPYNSQMQAIITPERIVGENYGLGKINGAHPEEQNWTNWMKWAKDGVINASTYGATTINGKYNQLLTISDYENLHTNLTTQTSSNFHTVALNSMADIAVGCVGFQYGAALNTLGYYTSNLYTGSNNVWALPADNTVPSQFIGKSSATNNRIVGVNEITYALEAILPEGFQVQDQNNQNWFTIKHFGAELDNTYNGGNLNNANAQHWATNVGVGVETMVNAHRSYPNGGQYVIAQLKNGNETDNGFHYDQRYAEFRGNKFANYVNRYGITNIRDVYDINGIKTGTEEYLQPMGSEYISNFMAEGQVFTAYFCGAKGINLWNSDFTDVAIPKTKTGNLRRGAKHNDVNYGNRDLESYTYTLKALWRLNQKITLSNGQQYSFNEICDGTEVYLNQATKVVYPGSSAITQLRALDWQILKKTCVRAVVNAVKNVVFVLAFQAYGVEQNQITFKLTDYGANISEVIDVPAGKIIVKAYPLVGGVSQGGTVTAPAISSNPTTPTAGSSVTFSSTTCNGGTVKWFVDDAQVSTGLSYTVTNPIANVTYKATCTVNGVSSILSNGITIAAAPVVTGVTITEPARTQYFYSNGQPPSFYSNRANLPAIITNTATFDEADVVKLKNNDVEFWFNLRRGGQICYASKASTPVNRVYNGYDGGFQWVYDGAQYLVNGQLNGASPDQTNNNINYNCTMGGDFQNHSQTLIDYHPVGNNAYYFKFRPILYNFISRVSEVEIEVTYTLVGKSLKADYKYTSFRTDGNIELNNPFRFMGFHVPICFLTNNFTKYSIYTGDSPWTNGGMTEGDIPNITGGINTPAGFQSKEFMGITFDPSNGFAVGVLNKIDNTNTQTSVTYEQLNKYSGGSAGTVFSGPYTTMALAESFAIPNGGNFERSSSVYFTLGDSVTEVRNELKSKAGH